MENYYEKDFQKELVSLFVSKNWKQIEIDKNECLNKPFFERSLTKYLKNKYSISEDEINEIIANINEELSSSWFKNNKYGIINVIKNGITTKFIRENKKVPYKIIDFKNIKNNAFEIAKEVWIEEHAKVDVVLFINGLPIFVFELKSIMNDNATLKDAFEQIKTYLETDNPKFATFNVAQIVAKSFSDAKIGSICTSSIDGWYNIFKERKNDSFFEIFKKNKILNYLRWGVLFSKNNKVKYILRHHQYDAVLKMQSAILNRKSGYIWHTQGSGKTITISALISSLKFDDKLISNTTIIDVDRITLSNNMFRTLQKIDPEHFNFESIQKANSRDHLKNYLAKRKYKGIIISTTQKFDNWGEISDRDDLIVISDEAHRTHSTKNYLLNDDKKTYLEKINQTLPNALKYGFTGTPIFETDKSTYAMFGECIHQYTMKQAEIDDIIVPIQIQIINAPLKIKKDQKINLSKFKKIRRKKEIIDLSKDRLDFITDEIKKKFVSERNSHYSLGYEDTFKAMVVTNSKKQGHEIYKLLLKKIFENNTNKIHFIADDKDRRDAEVHKYLKKTSKNKRFWINDFQNAKTPIEIIVVVDMLLTGYDVPNLRLMFLDKNIQKHNLLQAITRVNRKFEKKQIGTVFSFKNIKAQLKETLKSYRDTTNDHSNLIQTSKDGEKSIKNLVKKINNDFGFDLTKINFKNPLLEVNKIKLELEENNQFNELIREINNLSTIVIKWKDKKLEKIALFCKLLFKSNQTKSPSFIDISDVEFRKLLNSTEIDKKLIKEVTYVSLDDVLSLKISDKQIILKIVEKKIIHAIKNDLSILKEERLTLFEQLKKIIQDYNNENFDITYEKIQNFGDLILKNNNFIEYTKLISKQAKLIINKNFSFKTLQKIDDKFKLNKEIWKQNPSTKKQLKREIREIILENEINLNEDQIQKIISEAFKEIESRGY